MGRKGLPISLAAQSVIDYAQRGTFIHKHKSDFGEDPCPFCGHWSYIAYLDIDWNGNQLSPDDVFECIGCGAFHTRRDAFGQREWGYWEKDKVLFTVKS